MLSIINTENRNEDKLMKNDIVYTNARQRSSNTLYSYKT